MYRTIANEKVVLGRAEMPEATARKTGFGALAVFAKHVINFVRHTLERASIVRELAALNDRELADIGLSRGDIPAVAERSVTAPKAPGLVVAFGEMVHDLVIAPVALWNKRRTAYSALNALDNRMLADIGVARAEIADVVKGLHRSVSYPALSLDLVAPIAAWNRARQTATSSTSWRTACCSTSAWCAATSSGLPAKSPTRRPPTATSRRARPNTRSARVPFAIAGRLTLNRRSLLAAAGFLLLPQIRQTREFRFQAGDREIHECPHFRH